MLEFFKNRSPVVQPLGPLEVTVMEILWARGEANVRDVVDRLHRPLAYTTIMTTLDRLYKKGLLARRKSDRAGIIRRPSGLKPPSRANKLVLLHRRRRRRLKIFPPTARRVLHR